MHGHTPSSSNILFILRRHSSHIPFFEIRRERRGQLHSLHISPVSSTHSPCSDAVQTLPERPLSPPAQTTRRLFASERRGGGVQRHDPVGAEGRINRAESVCQPEPTRRAPLALNCIVGGGRSAAFSSLLSRIFHTGALIHCTLFSVKHVMKEGKSAASCVFGFLFSLQYCTQFYYQAQLISPLR